MSETTERPEAGLHHTSPEEEMLSSAARMAGENAPWRRGISWQVVLVQGVVLGVVGAALWLIPGWSTMRVLQLLAVVLLASGALAVWRLLRGRIAPRRAATVGFRAGVGLAVGLIVVIGSLIVDDREVVTVAVAIILGIGLVLYGLSAVATALAGREPGSGVPVLALVVAAVTIVVGVLLVINGRDGVGSLQGTFALLGILLLVAGIAIAGWGVMLRQQALQDPGD